MTDTPFIIGINGSPYMDGIVCELLGSALQAAAEDGAETKTIHLYNLNMIPTEGHYSRNPASETIEENFHDDITDLYPDIVRADGLVLATPVYWANMSAVMKNFIEHLLTLASVLFLRACAILPRGKIVKKYFWSFMTWEL